MATPSSEAQIREFVRSKANEKCRENITAFAQKQQENINAGREPFHGLDPYGALTGGVVDVLIDAFFDVIKNHARVAPGIGTLGGDETTESGIIELI